MIETLTYQLVRMLWPRQVANLKKKKEKKLQNDVKCFKRYDYSIPILLSNIQ